MLKPPDFHDTRFSAAGRADAALMPAADRQRLIETLLVRYPRHRAMTKFIARFHRPVNDGTHDRGHIGALLGATRSGKSWVLRDYVSAFPSTEGNGIVRRPVIYIELMNDMAAHDVACKSFTSLGYASIPKVKTDALMAMVIDALPDHGVELIVLDDVDNALHSHRTAPATPARFWRSSRVSSTRIAATSCAPVDRSFTPASPRPVRSRDAVDCSNPSSSRIAGRFKTSANKFGFSSTKSTSASRSRKNLVSPTPISPRTFTPSPAALSARS